MIEWNAVLDNSIWLTGAAIMLAVISFASYEVAAERAGPRAFGLKAISNGWMPLGGRCAPYK